jgi:hypothetical protein
MGKFPWLFSFRRRMADTKLSHDDLIRWKMEIRMREKYLEQELTPIIQENLERYTGHYIPGMAQDWDIILNEFFSIMQYNLPSIFFRNPRVFLKPRQKTYIAKKRNPLSGVMEEVEMDSTKSAKTQEGLINYILEEIKYKKEVRRILFDALAMPYGVMWHGYKGEFGMTEEQSLYIKKESLWVKRISPLRFLWDPSVTIANIDEARWVGRSFDIPLQDLIEDETLDVDQKLLQGKVGFGQKVGTKDALNQLAVAQNGIDFLKIMQQGNRALIEYTSDAYRKSKSVRFVTCYELFIRPSKKEARDGDKGKVVLLTDEQTKPLRVSVWPYKAEGWPSEILQFNEVQDSQFGLDDFKTYSSLADQKNILSNEFIRNCKQLNKVWVAMAKEGMSGEEDQQKIRDGRNTVVMFDGDTVQGKMVVASASGGASNELPTAITMVDQNLQQTSGLTDLKKGIQPKSGEESAESVQIRNMGGNARTSYRQDLMADFLKASIHKLNQYNKQFMTVDQAVRIIGSLDVQWTDNPSKDEIQADTDVELDVYSMLPEDPQVELQQLQTALGLAIQAIEDPSGKLTQKLGIEGYTFEIAPLIEQILMRIKIRNPDVFRRIKPEESQGYASVAELRAAKNNVTAALAGSPQIPSPPAPGQDHGARLEVYGEAMNVLQASVQTGMVHQDSPALQIMTQLIQLQTALQQQEQEETQAKTGTKIPSTKKSFGTKMMGTK